MQRFFIGLPVAFGSYSLAASSLPYTFELTVRHHDGQIRVLSSADHNSAIQIIDNIPHVILNSGDFTMLSYIASLPLPAIPNHIFDPHGFGRVVHCKSSVSNSCSFDNAFPAMQFAFAKYHESLLYFGAHDPHAFIKSIAGNSTELRISGPLELRKIPENRLVPIVEFAIVAESMQGDYYDAALRYRSFIFSANPDWVGVPLAYSPMDTIQLWVNTHWQEYDVFSKSGGKPDAVRVRVLQLLDLLRDVLSPDELALHWYEWDTLGFPVDEDYHGVCDNAVRCGFDSHYPEYFPARENFESVVEELSQVGVKIFPYINGRIFDTNLQSWNSEARWSALKNSTGQVYLENYGNGVDFAPMCPMTQFWKETIWKTVDTMFEQSAVTGVYIDQVACAAYIPCYDETHDHPPGGGHFWTQGYREMLEHMRNEHPQKLFVTESNVEQFIGSFDGFLTLPAFWDDTEDSTIVPVFQAVYGGYIRVFGSVFHALDLQTSLFREKLSLQFIFGAQLGWFSLTGSDENAGFPTVGMLENLLDPSNALNVRFLKTLLKARREHFHVFHSGRAGRRLNRFGQIWNVDGRSILIAVNPQTESVKISGHTVEALSVFTVDLDFQSQTLFSK